MKEEILEVLKGYADVLKEDTKWLEGYPFSPGAQMAAGRCEVRDCNNDLVAVFVSKSTDPTFPIAPRDIQVAGILCEVLNCIAENSKSST